MDFEDSGNALFCDPNAYIQRFEKKEKCNPRKIVFQQPYESMPNFYIDNNFKKGDCGCIPRGHDCDCNHGNKQQKNQTKNNHDCNCDYQHHHDDDCHNNKTSKQNGFDFDLKNLFPLLSMLNNGGGANLSQLVGMLNNTNNSQNVNNSNPMNLISSILSNPNALSGILNMFKGGGVNLFGRKQTTKKELKTTDFEIKNYTRVE